MTSRETERLLGWVCDQIAAHRARVPRLERGQLGFAVVERDGLTDLYTIDISKERVQLRSGPPALPPTGPEVTIFAELDQLVAMTRGEASAPLRAEGDGQLLGLVSRCFADGGSPVSVRGGG